MRSKADARNQGMGLLLVWIVVSFISSISVMDISSLFPVRLLHLLSVPVIAVLLSRRIDRKNHKKIGQKLIILGCVLVVFVASAVLKGSGFYSSDITKNLYYPVMCVALFLIINGEARISLNDVAFLLNAVILLGIISGVFNIFYNIGSFSEIFTMSSSYAVRFQSFFNNRNIYGTFMFLSIFASFTLYALKGKQFTKNEKTIWLSSVLFLAFNLLLTFSRGAILATLLFLGITAVRFVLPNKTARHTLFKMAGVISIVLLIIFLIPISRNYVLQMFIRPHNISTHRDEIYNYAWNYYVSHDVLFGSGAERSLDEYGKAFEFSGFHNSYLSVLIMFGLVGLAAYLVLLAAAYKQIRKLRVYHMQLSYMLEALFICIIVYGLYESRLPFSYYHSATYSILLFLLPKYLYNWYSVNIASRTIQLVSIIIPTYNRPHTLRRAIDSALNQDYPKIEVIVVDDNPTGSIARRKCREILKEYPSVKYIRNPRNIGGGMTRNIGIRAASGEYIAFLDDDDEFHRDKIQKQIALMTQKLKEDKNTAIVYCGICSIKTNGHKRKRICSNSGKALYEHMLNFTMPTSTWLCRKAVLEEVGMFDDIKSQQDLMLMLRILDADYSIYPVPECLTNFYIHKPGAGISAVGDEFIEQVKWYQDECRKRYGILSEKEKRFIEHNFRNRLFNCYLSKGDEQTAKMYLLEMFKMRPFAPANFKNMIKLVIHEVQN